MTFHLEYPIADMRPAPYNPRLIDGLSLGRLQESIQVLGLIKPVICTADGTLLAGHQRTRAMLAEGMTHCPAFVLREVSTQDEIRFNQLHNAADLELGEAVLSVPPQSQLGYVDIPPGDISGQLKAQNATKRNEILRLLNKHGAWGSIVVNQSGAVLVSKLYAMASRMLGLSCKACVVPDEQSESVLNYFSQSYGKFSYEHLPRTTWGQALAQKPRLRTPVTSTKVMHSRTYESLVIPRINKEMRILDFGAGQMDYVKHLKSQEYNIRGIEFYFRKARQINVKQVNNDIDTLCLDLQQNGLYDLVVCDSVINSVDGLQAEIDVLTCLSALCRRDGTIIFSGRSREEAERNNSSQSRTGPVRYVHFFDDDGFTAMFADGVWRYQKLHTIEEAKRIAPQYFGPSFQIYELGSKPLPAKKFLGSNSWAIVTAKQIELPFEQRQESLAREFDLPLPEGRRYGRSKDILQAYAAALSREEQACISE